MTKPRKDSEMNDEQLLRYARHIQLPEIDLFGQSQWINAHVLIIGVGGLGSPAAMYLAASGIGHLTLVDDDTVSLSNLQRQILFNTSDLSRFKTEAAQTHLHQLNPDINIHIVTRRADETLLDELTPQADVILDCSDNFTTRHTINRVCVRHQKPLVSGAAIRFDGQISVFNTQLEHSPCYACLFPPEQHFPDEPCATLGVFAPLVGIIGTMQAAEALKIIAQVNASLVGQLLILDARIMQWHTLQLHRNPYCSVCAK